jgi:hypothetical protein
MQDSNDRSEGIKKLRKAIAAGEFEQVDLIGSEYDIGKAEAVMVATTLFQEYFDKDDFRHALLIGQHFELDPLKRDMAIRMEFGKLLAQFEYEQAIQWSSDYGMSKNEVMSAVVKLFEEQLNQNNAEGAMEIAERYNVPKDMVMNSALKWFNRACLDKQFYWACKVGKMYEVPEKRVLIVAMKAMLEGLKAGDWAKVFDLQEQFDVISDFGFAELREQDRQMLVDHVYRLGIQKLVKEERVTVLCKIVEKLSLLNPESKISDLRRLAGRIHKELIGLHNNFMKHDQLDDAIWMCAQFPLLAKGLPIDGRQSLIRTVQNKHNECMRKDDYPNAKKLRLAYELFRVNVMPDIFQESVDAAKGFLLRSLHANEIALVIEVALAYDIPKKMYAQEIVKVCAENLKTKNFEKAFALREKFKLDVTAGEIKSAANKQFDIAFKENLNEVAAEIGRQFKLNKHKTRKLAVRAWRRLIETNEMDAAKNLAKRHQLSLRLLQKEARKLYMKLVRNNETEKAERLRKDYKFSLNLFEMFFEFFRGLFVAEDD